MNAILAIDGGNSKTDVALVAADGAVLGSCRTRGFQPHRDGLEAALHTVEEAVERAAGQAGLSLRRGPVCEHTAAFLAHADLPAEELRLHEEIVARRWSKTTSVSNDTFALLRAGTDRGWGVAVVCGAGINCVGVAPDGRVARFPALGRLSGDWGGGDFLGEEVLWWAARGEDGRGPHTGLQQAVTEQFGTTSVFSVTVGVHTGAIAASRLTELTPALFTVAAAGDAVAKGLVNRLAHEVVTLATGALRRLDLLEDPTIVVLGGSVLAADNPALYQSIERRLAYRAPHAKAVTVAAPPIVGAALHGLDYVSATLPDRTAAIAAERRLRDHFAQNSSS